jgi:uncharacterized protein YdeI (YjbR/CyaY-like superfamily)
MSAPAGGKEDNMATKRSKKASPSEAGARRPGAAKPGARPSAKRLPIPDELAAVLAGSPEANAVFLGLPPSHQNEYVRWVTDGKREPTRQKRAEKAVGMLTAGVAKRR